MTDLVDMMQDAKERIERMMATEQKRSRKIKRDVEELMLLADALALLRDLPSSHLSEGTRMRAAGLKRRIRERLAA